MPFERYSSRPSRSLRQARLPEPRGERVEVLRPSEWCQIAQLGCAQIGIAFACARHGSLCKLEPSGLRIAGRGNTPRQQENRIVARGLFGARRRHVVAAREKMSIRHASIHAEHVRIERTQAHGPRYMLEREFRLASPDSQPRTERPGL